MFPFRFSTIFRNRWMALVWAAGIIWFAYDFAASETPDDNSAAEANQVADALNAF